MMNLSLMRDFYETVDDGGSPILDSLASRWGNSFECRIVRASANFVAEVQTEGEKHYLRFNHESERSTQHIENELRYIRHITSRGINANTPIPSLAGRLVESIDTPLGVMNGVLFTEVEGEHIESSELDLDGYSLWGESLASIHNASHGLELVDAPSWRDQLEMLHQQTQGNSVLVREAETILDRLSGVPRDNYGLIVFDFEMDNIKWLDGIPGFMDFDDYCVHWYAADIAYALRDLYTDRVYEFDHADGRFKAFIAGYRGARSISDAELELIPMFLRLHNLFFYARLSKANIEPKDDDPDWVKRLSKRLAEKNESYLRDIIESPLT